MDEEKEDLLNQILFIAKNEVRAEIYKEVNDRKEKKTLYTEQAKELYDKFRYDNPIVKKQLRKSLPLRIRLLNKVTVIGMALMYEDTIQYTYYFNDDYTKTFVFKPYIDDMKKWR